MRIKDLPEPAKSLALKYQKKSLDKANPRFAYFFSNPNDYLLTAFNWADTKEGSEYWAKLSASDHDRV